MADNEQTDNSLFFAASDDEKDDELEYVTPPAARPASDMIVPEPHPQTNSLFFADSEDEDDSATPGALCPSIFMSSSGSNIGMLDEKMDVDVGLPQDKSGRTSSMSSASSVTPPAPSSPASSVGPEISIEPPRKKRRLSPDSVDVNRSTFVSGYLGSFLVGDAWSTVRGKGFVKVCHPLINLWDLSPHASIDGR
jgi:hypothetical protein